MKFQPYHLTKLRQRFSRKELANIFETSSMTLWRKENPTNRPCQKRGPKPKVDQNTLKYLVFTLRKTAL